VTIKKIEACNTWRLRQEVMWPDKEIDYVKLADDPRGTHYGLFEDEQLVSVISLFFDGEDIQFRKFATCSHKQRQGLGTRLLRFILQEAEATTAKRIWCNARVDASEFYRRFGFLTHGKSFQRDGVTYIKMLKELDREIHRT
jgi:predicted GNAT family N-acyltransferase